MSKPLPLLLRQSTVSRKARPSLGSLGRGLLIGTILSVAAIAVSMSSSCGIPPKTVANVLKPTAEQCVEISRQKGNSKLETVCATIEDLAPFIPEIFAYQQKRLGLAAPSASSAAPAAPVAPPSPAPTAPASSSPVAPAAACSCK